MRQTLTGIFTRTMTVFWQIKYHYYFYLLRNAEIKPSPNICCISMHSLF